MSRSKSTEDRRAYYRAHKEQEAANARAYRAKHKDKLNANKRAWYIANKAIVLAYAKAYHAEHAPERNAYDRVYQIEHRAERTAASRAYRLAHPGYAATNSKRYRARKRGAPLNDLTHTQWLEIQATQDHRCYYCGKRCKGHLTQDHITPLSEGGSHTLHNVIGACRSCNSKKHTSAPPIPVQPLLLTIARARKKA